MANSISKNYAEALFSICMERNLLSEMQMQMKQIKDLILENNEIVTFLNSYLVSFIEKEEFIDKAFKEFDADILSMIKILVKNHRSKYLIDVIDNFNSLINKEKGVLEGLLYSIYPLEKQKIKEIENAISKKENVPCELKNLIDKNIIGGIKVVINGHIYDGSIQNKIESMRIALNK